MSRWEYTSATVHIETWNFMGKDGWELVAVYNGIAYFKRPIDGRRTVK